MTISLHSISVVSNNVDHSSDVLNPLRPVRNVAIVDDNPMDYKLLKLQLLRSSNARIAVEYYPTLSDFLDASAPTPDAVILDRHLPESGLSECYIREIRHRHKKCGVIIYTGVMTPSLRSTASHEGAIAVVEKGTLDSEAIQLLVETASVLGPQLNLPGDRS